MRREHTITIPLPEGVTSTYEKGMLSCSKDGETLQRAMKIPGATVTVKEGSIVIQALRANKPVIAKMKSYEGHIKNMFKGLDEPFVYELEICHVHFPMTCKQEGNIIEVSKFLGERTNRYAKVLPGVDVAIKGNQITVTSRDLEKAGQTAANLEKATKVPNKDRRVFQDGIFMTSKPGGAI